MRLDAPYGQGERWVEVAPAAATTTIALVPRREGDPTRSEVSLTTRDTDADHAALRARGVDADATVMRLGDQVPPMFTFRDPGGNRLRMVQRGWPRGFSEGPRYTLRRRGGSSDHRREGLPG